MNNDENPFEFKDKEIEKITSEITKESKHQLGESFQDAIARGGGGGSDGGIGETPAATQSERTESSSVTTAGLSPIQTMGSDLGQSTTQPELHTGPTETPSANTPSQEKTEEPGAVIMPLQTYERDIAEAIRSNNESVASINLAQQKRVQEKASVGERTEKIARKGLTFLISLVLIISAVGISALVYYFVINRPGPVEPTEPSLIITDEKYEIDVTGLLAPAVAAKIKTEIEKTNGQDAGNAEGKIVRIELTQNIVIPKDPKNLQTTKQTLSAERFFEFFALSSPPTLGRALGDQWVYGFQNIENSRAPFIFASVESFDNAFEGMHRWEERMAENLKPIFFDLEIKNVTNTTSTTSTTTVAAVPTPISSATNIFSDLIIRSKDARVLKDSAGKIILLYSFLDQKNLVITTNEKTFEELLNRFFSSQIVR